MTSRAMRRRDVSMGVCWGVTRAPNTRPARSAPGQPYDGVRLAIRQRQEDHIGSARFR